MSVTKNIFQKLNIRREKTTYVLNAFSQLAQRTLSINPASVTKTEVYTILRKYWRNRCARQCLPPPLFVTQKGCRSEFQNPPIKRFTSKINYLFPMV
jgi:hypothetical protein